MNSGLLSQKWRASFADPLLRLDRKAPGLCFPGARDGEKKRGGIRPWL